MNIRLFGKNILTTKHHLIMEYDISPESDDLKIYDRVVLCADEKDFPNWRGGGYSREMLSGLLKDYKCEGFYYVDEETGQTVGTIWIMFSGGNEAEYRIRSAEAFIFNVYVREDYRGRGIASRLLDIAVNDIRRKGIKKCCLAVRTNNKSAIRAYDKYGFQTVDKKFFIRVLGKNIPYHRL